MTEHGVAQRDQDLEHRMNFLKAAKRTAEQPEQGHMRWIVTTIGLLLVIVGIWATEAQPSSGQRQPATVVDEIVARRIVIVDRDGGKRAILDTAPDGEVRLELRDAQSKVGTWLSPNTIATSTLAILGADESALIELGSVEGQAPVFVMRDAAGTRRIAATAVKDGGAFVLVNDTQGRKRCVMAFNEKQEPQMTLFDASAKPRVNLAIDGQTTCSLDLRDAQGRTRLIARFDDGGEAALLVLDEKGNRIWSAPAPSVPTKK